MFADVQHDPKKVREIESEAWEDFLDMTMSQALLWASENIDPAKTPSEVVLTEPYYGLSCVGDRCVGQRSRGCGAPEYFWGYNRMTTVRGLFAAGDGVSGSAHKFSSGSFTEGRLAAKAAVAYVHDNPDTPELDPDRCRLDQAGALAPDGEFSRGRRDFHRSRTSIRTTCSRSRRFCGCRRSWTNTPQARGPSS